MKKVFLQGKLTKLGAAILTVAQTPNLLSDISFTAQVFADSAAAPLTWLSLVGAVGVIFGGIRRVSCYQLPRLVTSQDARVESLVKELEELRRSQASGVGPSAWARPVSQASPFEIDRENT